MEASGIESAWRLFAAADWKGARDAFAAALERDPEDPEALDGLGQSLWWLGDRQGGIDSRRQAYATYQRRGNPRAAGGIAAYLAAEHRIDGQTAEAAGWLARARRLLDGHGVTSELGWLRIEEAKRADDPVEAERQAAAALEVAQDLNDRDVECMALAQLGRAAVRQGRTAEGIELIDEAMTVALSGETSDPLACGDACCTTLVVCDDLADLDRAMQWCEAVVDFTTRRRFVPVQSWCRSIYAGVLIRAGDWERAEEVLDAALGASADRRRGSGRALPLSVLAELRLRQGRRQPWSSWRSPAAKSSRRPSCWSSTPRRWPPTSRGWRRCEGGLRWRPGTRRRQRRSRRDCTSSPSVSGGKTSPPRPTSWPG
jgi:tetratricopeptide (TPR) repeat protein